MDALLVAAALAALALLLWCVLAHENFWRKCLARSNEDATEMETAAEMDTVQFIGGRRMTIGGKDDDYDYDGGEDEADDDGPEEGDVEAAAARHALMMAPSALTGTAGGPASFCLAGTAFVNARPICASAAPETLPLTARGRNDDEHDSARGGAASPTPAEQPEMRASPRDPDSDPS